MKYDGFVICINYILIFLLKIVMASAHHQQIGIIDITSMAIPWPYFYQYFCNGR